ncbi:hypothetical protein ACE14D_07715, partial [Streptomyces sp. Act-28]
MLLLCDAMRNAPVGHVETPTFSAPVTAADLAGGDLRVALYPETFHVTRKSWTADQFTITAELDGCAVRFLRAFVIDCDTGAVLRHSDTTPGGEPYTPTGQVGQCGAPGSSSSWARSARKAAEADRHGDGTGGAGHVGARVDAPRPRPPRHPPRRGRRRQVR